MEAGPEAPWPRCAFDTRAEPNGANAAHGDFVDVVPSPSRHSATGPTGPLFVGRPRPTPSGWNPRCPETGAGPVVPALVATPSLQLVHSDAPTSAPGRVRCVGPLEKGRPKGPRSKETETWRFRLVHLELTASHRLLWERPCKDFASVVVGICWNCGLVAFPSRPWIKKQGISRGEARKPQTELPHQRLLIYLIYLRCRPGSKKNLVPGTFIPLFYMA